MWRTKQDVPQTNKIAALEEAGFFEDCKEAWAEETKTYEPKRVLNDHAPLSVELGMLLEREKIGFLKNPAAVVINVSITAFLGVVFGVIFFQVGQADRSDPTVIQSQLGAVINILISTMFGQSQVALSEFPTERPMFLREYSTRHYSVVTYFASRLVTEAFQTLLATTVQALIVFFMIGFQQSFLQFLSVSFSLAMTSTAVSVLLGSFFSDPESARSMFTVRHSLMCLPLRHSNNSSIFAFCSLLWSHKCTSRVSSSQSRSSLSVCAGLNIYVPSPTRRAWP